MNAWRKQQRVRATLEQMDQDGDGSVSRYGTLPPYITCNFSPRNHATVPYDYRRLLMVTDGYVVVTPPGRSSSRP